MAEGVAAGSEADPTTGISKRVNSLAEWVDTHPIFGSDLAQQGLFEHRMWNA